MNNKAITAVVDEAKKILHDYPHMKMQEAVRKAKEVLGYGADERDKSNSIQD